MSSYNGDRAWSDRFIPEIKTIVGPLLLQESTLEVDRREAADLIVLNARDKKIAARVRRPGYAEKYPNQFTVRAKRDSGATTELEKIVNGFGDWMFYGHADFDDTLARWMVIDLASFRAHLLRDGYRGDRRLKSGQMPNGDGTYFQWFDVTSFVGEPPILLASSDEHHAAFGAEVFSRRVGAA